MTTRFPVKRLVAAAVLVLAAGCADELRVRRSRRTEVRRHADGPGDAVAVVGRVAPELK